MILVKELRFFRPLCSSEKDGEKHFADILNETEAFRDY